MKDPSHQNSRAPKRALTKRDALLIILVLFGISCLTVLSALLLLPSSKSVSLKALPSQQVQTINLSSHKADPPKAELGSGDLYALLVGVSKYKYNNKIPPLGRAATDAEAVGAFLKTQEKIFGRTHIKVMANEQATKKEIERYLNEELRNKARKDDTIILFFSGHGEPDPSNPGEFYFLAYDSEMKPINPAVQESQLLTSTAIKMSGLEFVDKLDAKRVLLIADACYAGGFSKWAAKSVKSPLETFRESIRKSSGRAILTSSKNGERSWEPPGLPNSLFTYYLLEGLKGKADKDGNRIVTLKEAYDYAYANTTDYSRGAQHPELETKIEGDFPVSLASESRSRAELTKEFFRVAESGKWLQVTELLNERQDIVNVRDADNNTPLILAAKNGHAAIVELLLDKGAHQELEAKSHTGNTALIAASEGGHTAIVKLLISKGADLEGKDGGGNTALHAASARGHKDVVELLLKHGANIHARNKYWSTALTLASYERHAEVAELLLKHDPKPDVNAVDSYDRTPLVLASRQGKKQIVRLLIKEGASVAAFMGSDSVHSDNRAHQLIEAALLGDAEAVARILDAGVQVDTPSASGDTALTLASGLGHVDVVRMLLDAGAAVNWSDKTYQSSALKWASVNGKRKVVKLLVERGAAIDAKDQGANTPLMYACQNGRKEIVEFLLSKGADVNVQSKIGNTPLMRASENGHEEIVKPLLEKGAEIGAGDEDGATALILAAQGGHSGIARMLLEKGANANARRKDGNSALTIAATSGNKEFAELLVGHGADVNASTREASALILAAKNGHTEIVKLLLSKGANASVKDFEGMTALELAERGKHLDVVRVLKGARSPEG